MSQLEIDDEELYEYELLYGDRYDKRGFNKEGIHKETGTKYDPKGFDKEGYNKEGYDKRGFNREGIHKNTGTKYNLKGYDIRGYDVDGCDFRGFNEVGDYNKYTNTKYDKKGYDIRGFNEEGFYKDISKRYNEKGFDKKGIHIDTGTEYNLQGYNEEGLDERGFDRYGTNRETGTKYDSKGFDKEGYDEKGFNEKGYNKKGIYRDTGTEYDTEGYNKEGYDINGYNKEGYDKKGFNKDGLDREGRDKNGRTEQDKINLKNKQAKNYLGLLINVKKLATGELSMEDYVKTAKTPIEELINFAKKQNMEASIITALSKRKTEYKQYKKVFSKKDYIGHVKICIGEDKFVSPTEEDVDKCIEYLKNNDRLICDKTVRDTVRSYIKGEINIDNLLSEKTELQIKEEKLQTLVEEELKTRKEMQVAKALKDDYEEQLENKEGKVLENN